MAISFNLAPQKYYVADAIQLSVIPSFLKDYYLCMTKSGIWFIGSAKNQQNGELKPLRQYGSKEDPYYRLSYASNDQPLVRARFNWRINAWKKLIGQQAIEKYVNSRMQHESEQIVGPSLECYMPLSRVWGKVAFDLFVDKNCTIYRAVLGGDLTEVSFPLKVGSTWKADCEREIQLSGPFRDFCMRHIAEDEVEADKKAVSITTALDNGTDNVFAILKDREELFTERFSKPSEALAFIYASNKEGHFQVVKISPVVNISVFYPSNE